MNEEEKKAIYKIQRLVEYFEDWNLEYTVVPEDKKHFDSLLNLIKKQQRELSKKDKIIDKMAEQLVGLPLNEKLLSYGYADKVKEYYTNLVEKENK